MQQPIHKIYGEQQQWLPTFLTLVDEESPSSPVLLSGAEPPAPHGQSKYDGGQKNLHTSQKLNLI